MQINLVSKIIKRHGAQAMYICKYDVNSFSTVVQPKNRSRHNLDRSDPQTAQILVRYPRYEAKLFDLFCCLSCQIALSGRHIIYGNYRHTAVFDLIQSGYQPSPIIWRHFAVFTCGWTEILIQRFRCDSKNKILDLGENFKPAIKDQARLRVTLLEFANCFRQTGLHGSLPAFIF